MQYYIDSLRQRSVVALAFGHNFGSVQIICSPDVAAACAFTAARSLLKALSCGPTSLAPGSVLGRPGWELSKRR
jgi:hypothetical protein